MDTQIEAGTKRGSIEPVVVVPRTPSPLQPVDREHRPADDLDQLIDEVFGDVTTEGPGLFDVALLVGGVLLTLWALLSGASGLLTALGIGLIALGLALPARSVLRAYRARRVIASRRRAAGTGLLLDVSHPSTSALAQSYGDLLEVARLPGARNETAATGAAHRAVVEAASLLEGRPPAVPAEIDYVTKRADAIQSLADEMRGSHQAWLSERFDDIDRPPHSSTGKASAIVQAREELDAATGLGALDELQALRTTMAEGDGDGDRG